MRSFPHRASSRLKLLPLIRTLVDITLLRKGPEAIPNSWILLYMSIGFWMLALVSTVALIANYGADDAWISISSAALAAVCYLFVLVAMGYGSRAIPTLAALIGSGAVIWFMQLASIVLLGPVLGSDRAGLVAFVVLVWSVPVKGNIIARAINWHWYAGIVIAFSIFLLQLAFTQFMSPEI